MRMVALPGKSIRRRRAICSGLHALAHRRGCRRPCRRPFQATAGPTTAAPPGVATAPDRRSCTYVRSAAVIASFALFGRRAARSACHCAVLARYASPPPRVAALRRNSREIVDAARPSRRAISRMPWPWARHGAISSRSANTRYRPESGFADGASDLGDIPPASRNQRGPTAGDPPASIAAASLDRPAAIAAQNRRGFSRCATPGRPGDRGNTARSARSERRFPALIATPSVKVLRRPLEPGLGALVAMVHETAALDGPALVQGLLKRVEHEAGVRRPAHPPADDAPGISIDHKGNIDEAGPGRDVGEIGDPEHVWARRLELLVDAIEWARRGLIADRGPHRLAPHGPLQAHGPHQPRHRAARHPDPLSAGLSPDLPDAIDAEVRLIHAPDLDHQCCIPPGSRGQPLRISPPGGMGVIRRRGDRQHPADRLDPVDGAMLVNEGDHGLDRRSSSAIAQYADALRRISLAWRSSRTSRPSAPMRSCSAVVGPARRP